MADLGWSVAEVARLTRGSIFGEAGLIVERVETDSREDVTGALFVAIKGERFDGHDFLHDVARRGAVAVLVEKSVSGLSIPQVVVGSTLFALASLGLARREQLKGPVVAITGSSGKTTTRRLLASIASKRYRTHQPIRNFNNHIGVPLTLLALEARHEAAVIELGCSDFGEIEHLTKCANPDVGLVTNVGPAHLERLGDLDGVARAKGELFLAMREDAQAVVNLDDPRVTSMPMTAKKQIRYGDSRDADARLIERRSAGVQGQKIVLELRGERVEGMLPLIGAHNATNALAAAAAALAIGLGPEEIVAGIAEVLPESGRLALREGHGGMLVIDDTYNANPASMRAALTALREIAAGKIMVAVLGDMLELGERSEEAHLSLGREVAAKNVDLLVSMGDGGVLIDRGAAEAGLGAGKHLVARDHDHAVELIRGIAGEDAVVLIKGSRGMRMEEVVSKLLAGSE
ncbi:MAG: UDP-N-acetylmuramoyl-tripeptide--D-alanyl-D-alanine ligase [Deltaproteobacteria bacterium]|nr:UDP-N-acetylmuramoyl-tripeptide--D-alanyl-D-alanine ligase [Deltaproteobacteria bacterium]